jgi:hypothetical protein
MARMFNLWSFVLCLLCLVLTGCFASSAQLTELAISLTGVHPLSIVLCLSVAAFLLGMVGFGYVNNWLTAVSSWVTVTLAVVLSIFLMFVGMVGKLLSLCHATFEIKTVEMNNTRYRLVIPCPVGKNSKKPQSWIAA